MAKTKISEFSTTAGNNTDINSINIAEGCAPSGINDAIRELMRQLKEFQTGGAGDSVNSGGDFSVATNKFTVAAASGNTAVAGTLAVTGVATLTAQPILSSLTASKAVFTDASKGLVSNDVTGTGNVVMSNSPTLVTPALGTPSSGVVTNLTGTASININGTVGATTPSTGAFTTLSSTGNTTLGDADTDTLTFNASFVTGTTLKSAKLDTNTLALAAYDVDGTAYTNLVTLTAGNSPTLALTSTGVGTINNMSIGATTASTGAFTTLSASGNVTLSGGTANGVLYLNGSKVATSGSALVFDGTNLGVGVTPSAWSLGRAFENSAGAFFGYSTSELHVTQNAYYNAGWKYTNSSVGAGRYFINSGAHSWYIAPSGTAGNAITFTQAMTLDSSGNLGLGVTPSAWTSLKVIQLGTTPSLSAGTNDVYLSSNSYFDGSWKYIGTSAATQYYQVSGTHVWRTAASGTAGNAITFTQAMTLDASGRLLVGLTSGPTTVTVATPSTNSNLGVYSNSQITLSNPTTVGAYSQIAFGYNSGTSISNAAAAIGFVSTSADTWGKGDLVFATRSVTTDTAPTERARIDSSGNLLVGQTALVNSERLGVTKNGNVFLVKNTQNTGTARLVYQNGAGTIDYFYNYASSSEIGTITNTTTSVAYNTTSDYRLKDNQQPLTGSGAFIDALKPKTWNWKTDGSRGVGFIAHEVQEVSPGSVVGEKDGEQMQAMEYGSAEFIANIIAELQSLRARVAQLESN